MKNQIGKKNMVFGFAYFITTLILGLFLAFKAKGGDPSWKDNPIHDILATSHVHGNLESVLNILSGYILCQLEANTGLLKTISTLLLIGAIFHSGMLYLTGLGVSSAINLAPIGAFSLIASVALMAYAVAVGFKK
ncbi:MAG: hypothetical protein PH343_02305 [Nitrospira sp.]|nr:hypothetical protein [Nitrospira sp.]